jgi:hypothetical protein
VRFYQGEKKMILIWKGLGCLVPLITVLVMVVVSGVLGVFFGKQANHSLENGIGIFVTFIISGGICWLVGQKLRDQHDFFFIPIRWWGVILAVLSLGGLFMVFAPKN